MSGESRESERVEAGGAAEAPASGGAPSGAPPGPERPSREDVEGWIGSRLDEIEGTGVGKVQGAYVDRRSGQPEWILIRTGRFGHHRVAPAREAVGGVGHVWVPWDRSSIRRSPRVDPDAELTPDDELVLCEHYGIVAGRGRVAELAGRSDDETSAVPLGF
jgi:hypothetical protein